MSYYPSFAFFSQPVDFKKVARILIEKLGAHLSQISFDDESLSQSPAKALSRLNQMTVPGKSMTFNNDLHQIEIRAYHTSLSINFWDFFSDLDQEGGASEQQKQEKRDLALILHTALVGSGGALLSYTNSYDAKYSGEPDLDEISDLVANALANQPNASLAPILERPSFYWLLAINKTRLQHWHKSWPELESHFAIVQDQPTLLIVENRASYAHPNFLRKKAVKTE